MKRVKFTEACIGDTVIIEADNLYGITANKPEYSKGKRCFVTDTDYEDGKCYLYLDNSLIAIVEDMEYLVSIFRESKINLGIDGFINPDDVIKPDEKPSS